MEGFVAKQEMPTYLSLLFRARRPLDTVRQLHKPVYSNRPQQPLIDCHRAMGEADGHYGHVTKDAGEGWLKAVFEEETPAAQGVDAGESKEEKQKRAQKAKIKEHLVAQKQD